MYGWEYFLMFLKYLSKEQIQKGLTIVSQAIAAAQDYMTSHFFTSDPEKR